MPLYRFLLCRRQEFGSDRTRIVCSDRNEERVVRPMSPTACTPLSRLDLVVLLSRDRGFVLRCRTWSSAAATSFGCCRLGLFNLRRFRLCGPARLSKAELAGSLPIATGCAAAESRSEPVRQQVPSAASAAPSAGRSACSSVETNGRNWCPGQPVVR